MNDSHPPVQTYGTEGYLIVGYHSVGFLARAGLTRPFTLAGAVEGVHLRPADGRPVLLDCGATSLSALKRLGLDPGEIAAVFVSHLHGDHFGGLPFLILDGQFSRRVAPLAVVGPPGTARRLADTMECLFPGSSTAARRFGVTVTELAPGTSAAVCGTSARAWEADHPNGRHAPVLHC